MAERTSRTAAKQPLTPTLWVLIVVVLARPGGHGGVRSDVAAR